MSFVVATPDVVTTAAQELAGIHSSLSEATTAAAGPTTSLMAAAEDEISAGVAAIFGAFGQEYQAVSAQAVAVHAQFVNLLNGTAAAYAGAEAANAQQIVTNALNAPVQSLAGGASITTAAATVTSGSIGGAYEALAANTAANMGNLANTWLHQTAPAMLRAATGYPQLIATSLATGNVAPLLNAPGQFALGLAKAGLALASPISLSVTSFNSSGASLALGVGLPELLAFDALGAEVNMSSAVTATNAQFWSAMAAGDPFGAATAFFAAPANIANALLNGNQTLTVDLPLPGFTLTANVPFTGLLVPLQPLDLRVNAPLSPLFNSVTVTGPPVGGLIPALVDYVPEVIADAFIP